MQPGDADQRHWLNLVVAGVVIGLVICFAGWSIASVRHEFSTLGEVLPAIRRTWWDYRDVLYRYFASPWIYVGVPLAFLATYLRPAVPGQPVFSREVAVDFAWTLLQKAFFLTTIILYFDFLEQLFDTHLAFLVVPVAVDMSAPARFIAGYLVADFLGWLHHLVRHKVPFLWSFHQFHHAQTELNPFSRERVHPLDYLFAQNIRFIPLLAFQNSFEILVAYFAFHTLQDTLNHANVRSNFGPLRHLFVSPQFHRIHHSTEERHFDTNFGVSLVIWDRLFGTASPDHASYPRTGVPDPTWPANAATIGGIPGAMWRQFCHPFVSAARTLRRDDSRQGTRMCTSGD